MRKFWTLSACGLLLSLLAAQGCSSGSSSDEGSSGSGGSSSSGRGGGGTGNDAGAPSSKGGSAGATSGECAGQGRSCASSDCCDGLSCLELAGGGQVCEQTCDDAAECDTDCCTDLRGDGNLVCADQDACDNPCKQEGASCSAGECCSGACIESDTSDFSGCRPLCTNDDDCDSGCCEQFSNVDGGFCVDAAYCSCVELDAECGPSVASPCCEGTTCATLTGPFSCFQICEDAAECPDDCCIPLPGTAYDICAGAEYCL